MRAPLNLASRPVRNERLPALLFFVAALVLLLVTVQHVLVASRLLPRRSAALRQEVADLSKEVEQLTAEAVQLRDQKPSAAQLTQWSALKVLVDRRAFRWSQLFLLLEQVLPPDIRVVSVNPQVKVGEYTLDLMVRAQSENAGLELVKTLERRPEFQDVSPRSIMLRPDSNEVEMSLAMRYLAQPPPAPAPVKAADAGPAQPEVAGPSARPQGARP